jgi:hypothetical protein
LLQRMLIQLWYHTQDEKKIDLDEINTTPELTFCGAPKYGYVMYVVVRHRLRNTVKALIVAHLDTRHS